MSQSIHLTSDVDDGAEIGEGTKVWRFCHIASTARIGSNCVIGQGCYIAGVVGDNCRIQNGAQVFAGVILEDDVFIGPGVVFTNVKRPRSGIKQEYAQTLVGRGATIGANATIVCGVEIGTGAMVGAGSVVTKNVPPSTTVVGNPARVIDG